MSLRFSTNGVFIRKMKLGDTKNHKNDPVKREPIVGRFVRQDCQNGGLSRSREGWRTGFQKGPILLTSLCQMSQGTVRTLLSGTSSGAL